MIFNVSGGLPLNYRIRAAAAAPTDTGTENEIVVVTSTPIGDVQINCAVAPTLRSDQTALQSGDVYMLFQLDSRYPFNALKRNAFYGRPGCLFQYLNGAWALQYAYIYQSGSWNPFSPASSLSDFTFTGAKTDFSEGSGNWRIKILSSGTLTCANDCYVDIFLVGGGGGGSGGHTGSGAWGASGGGRYTKTERGKLLTAGTHTITIGAGGAGVSVGVAAGPGGTTSLDSYSITGGLGGNYTCYTNGSINGGHGGNGGSGGACWTGSGGTDGGNGSGSHGQYTGGTGQGATTREFGESGATLYASGGSCSGPAGAANTGNGGGGGNMDQCAVGKNGGSGIVVIRNTRPII